MKKKLQIEVVKHFFCWQDDTIYAYKSSKLQSIEKNGDAYS